MIAKCTHYVRGELAPARKALSAHMRYMMHRSRELGESNESRRLFGPEDDSIERKDAERMLLAHGNQRLRYHKIVLSPSKEEPVEDWQKWTRAVMADLAERKQIRLKWVAVHHQNTKNHHVHVLLAGIGHDYEDGRRRLVIMDKEAYRSVRESGREHSDYAWWQDYKRAITQGLEPTQRQERNRIYERTENRPMAGRGGRSFGRNLVVLAHKMGRILSPDDRAYYGTDTEHERDQRHTRRNRHGDSDPDSDPDFW